MEGKAHSFVNPPTDRRQLSLQFEVFTVFQFGIRHKNPPPQPRAAKYEIYLHKFQASTLRTSKALVVPS
jgi:hypothetical protein